MCFVLQLLIATHEDELDQLQTLQSDNSIRLDSCEKEYSVQI